MESKIKKIRGTYDIYDKKAQYFLLIRNVLIDFSLKFNIKYIETPIIENAMLFNPEINDDNFVASKEIYSFLDKKQRKVSLRPEGTASVMRCVLENKLYSKHPLPLKFFYFGPMFRYERPQKNRYRQFFQYGLEYIGIKNDNSIYEIIIFINSILKYLNIKNIELRINHLGSIENRNELSKKLFNYFNKYKDKLCDNCKIRLIKNPLRIIDCKIDKKKDFVLSFDKKVKVLDSKEEKQFSNLLNNLKKMNINFIRDSKIVRGLDYYSGIVFEYTLKSNVDIAVVGGGFYTLNNRFGTDTLNSLGFSIGIERLIECFKENNQEYKFNNKLYYILAKSEESMVYIKKIIDSLLNYKLLFEINYGNKIKNHITKALKMNANYIIIIGDKEISSESFIVKDLVTRNEKLFSFKDLKKWKW